LAISSNDALFNLLGTTYGGDGQTTFAVPDLRGRVPLHTGNNFALGAIGGSETVSLTVSQLPAHTHLAQCMSGVGTASSPEGNFPAANKLKSDNTPFDKTYAAAGAGSLLAATVTAVGGSMPHNNIQPSLALNFIIATEGIYPSQG
jgi:microcystin-dependent protein